MKILPFPLIFLISLVVSVQGMAADKQQFLGVYKKLSQAKTYESARKLYTKSYNDSLVDYMKSQCGIRCIFGLNDVWQRKLENYVVAMISARNDWEYFSEYDVEKIEDEVHFSYIKSSCRSDSNRGLFVFIYEDDMWKIDREEISLHIETNENKLSSLQSNPGCILEKKHNKNRQSDTANAAPLL